MSLCKLLVMQDFFVLEKQKFRKFNHDLNAFDLF